MIYQQILLEYRRLEKKIAKIKKKLALFPPGKLLCAKDRQYCKWYQSDGKTKKYIPKHERKIAEQLAQKRYFTCLLEDLEKERNALSYYLRHHSSLSKSEEFLSHPEYQDLLSSYFKPQSQDLAEWMNAPYEKNMKYPENLIHKGMYNQMFRSKSEVLIAMLLQEKRIPFRYECILNLSGNTIFPDFTIRHPVTGAYYYWEHLGMLDDSSYLESALEKLNLYAQHGIYLGINLIITYETKNNPLSPETVLKQIALYFES